MTVNKCVFWVQENNLFVFPNLLSLTGNAVMDTSPQSCQNLLTSKQLLFWETLFFLCNWHSSGQCFGFVSHKWNMGVLIWGLNNICHYINFSPMHIFVWLSIVVLTYIGKTFASFLKQNLKNHLPARGKWGNVFTLTILNWPYNNDLCLIQEIVGLVNDRPTYLSNICNRLSMLFGSRNHSAACLLTDTALKWAERGRVGCLQHCSMFLLLYK